MEDHAVDDLLNLFTKSNHDLTAIQRKLEKDFQQTYPDNVNPLKLVSRIKRIQDDLLPLKQQCRELLAAKQDLIDKARTILVGNKNLLQRMQSLSGMPIVDDSNDLGYANLIQIIDEWTTQVRAKAGDEKLDSDGEDINQLLFSAIVQNN